MRDMQRKAQIEAFGLAIIVILIIIGFFIFISLRSQHKEESPINKYIPQEMASNIVNSMVNVDVAECPDTGFTISKLVQYCALGEDVSNRCSDTGACELVNATVAKILNKTLMRQGYGYYFYTRNLGWPAGGEIRQTYRDCSNRNREQSGQNSIPLYPTLKPAVTINLQICR